MNNNRNPIIRMLSLTMAFIVLLSSICFAYTDANEFHRNETAGEKYYNTWDSENPAEVPQLNFSDEIVEEDINKVSPLCSLYSSTYSILYFPNSQTFVSRFLTTQIISVNRIFLFTRKIRI